MSEIFAFLSQNPAYAAGAVLLLVLGAFSLFKKLLKLTIITVILALGYGYYLHSEGKALPTSADASRLLQQGKAMTGQIEKEAQVLQQQAQQAAKTAADAKAKVETALPKAGTR